MATGRAAHPAVYVINLARATERMAALRAQLDGFGWPFHRIEALDARATDAAGLRAIAPDPWSAYQARRMTPGEICCLASHRTAWQRIVDDGAPWGLVLEDDALLGPAVPAALAAVERQSFFDVVKLEGITTKPHKNRGVPIVAGPPAIFLLETVSAGAAACCISRAGAQKLLAVSAPMNREADFFIRQYGRSGLRVGEVRPFPATQDRSTSFIGSGRQRSARLGPQQRLMRTLVRAADSVSRRVRFRRLAGLRRAGPVTMEGSSADVFGTEP